MADQHWARHFRSFWLLQDVFWEACVIFDAQACVASLESSHPLWLPKHPRNLRGEISGHIKRSWYECLSLLCEWLSINFTAVTELRFRHNRSHPLQTSTDCFSTLHIYIAPSRKHTSLNRRSRDMAFCGLFTRFLACYFSVLRNGEDGGSLLPSIRYPRNSKLTPDRYSTSRKRGATAVFNIDKSISVMVRDRIRTHVVFMKCKRTYHYTTDILTPSQPTKHNISTYCATFPSGIFLRVLKNWKHDHVTRFVLFHW